MFNCHLWLLEGFRISGSWRGVSFPSKIWKKGESKYCTVCSLHARFSLTMPVLSVTEYGRSHKVEIRSEHLMIKLVSWKNQRNFVCPKFRQTQDGPEGLSIQVSNVSIYSACYDPKTCVSCKSSSDDFQISWKYRDIESELQRFLLMISSQVSRQQQATLASSSAEAEFLQLGGPSNVVKCHGSPSVRLKLMRKGFLAKWKRRACGFFVLR